MERKDFEELYEKSPKEIIEHVKKDMLKATNNIEMPYEIICKITEWMYVLDRGLRKI